MDTNMLLDGLNKIVKAKRIKVGVISADQVKSMLNVPSPKMYIANLQSSKFRGNHWISIYSPKLNEYEIFDSYGKSVRSFGMYFNELAKLNPLENCKTLQSLSSSVCGQYALFYSYHRLNNSSYVQIMSKFGCSQLVNDRIVDTFYNSYIKCNPICNNSNAQSCCSRKLNMYNKRFI
jgi:hypothetical protein